VSHEIRGPLGAVVTLSELLLSRELGASERRLVELMRLAGNHALGIAEDLVTEAGYDSGRPPVVAAPFDPARLVRDLAELWSPVLYGENRGIEVRVAPGTPPLMISDETRVRQILFNLVSNATRHADGPITITLRPRGRSVSFEVADSGAADGRAGSGGGLGIGLWISRRIAEALGGRLVLTPRHGGGTIGRLTVPADVVATRRARPRPAASAARPEPDRTHPLGPGQADEPPGRVHALVIDDNAVSRMLLSTVLGSFGIAVSAVAGGRAAADAAAKGRPDVVVVDWTLAGETGADALAKVRDVLGDIMPPAVVVSALARPPAVSGIAAVVAKPFTPGELHAAIATAVATTDETGRCRA
jgi:CheY-like chemotaxis protein